MNELLQERYGHMKAAALRVIGGGEEEAECLESRNMRPYPTLRAMIAYSLHREGFTYVDIGKCMNRSHTSMSVSAAEFENVLKSNLLCNYDTISAYMKFKDFSGTDEAAVITAKVMDIKEAIRDAFKDRRITEKTLDNVIINIKKHTK